MGLLTYLALATSRGFHPRDTLLALFWPEHDTEHARNSLNQTVHALRRALGPEAIVSRNGDAVAVDPREVWCDGVAFEEALEAGRLDEALDLYRGDLLEGFHIANAPDFERWLEGERVRLGHRFSQAIETYAAQREAAGDFAAAIAQWRRLAARDPFNSRVALQLMKVMAAGGDPGGAIQHARVHERLMREELNVAPDADVSAFVRRLQTGPEPRHARLAVTPPASHDGEAVPIPERVKVQTPRLRAAIMSVGFVALAAVGAGAVMLRNGTPESPAASIRSLAVLPLENLSGDSTQRPFSDGMHDALITELARYPDLKVISRTSVLRYRRTTKSLPEIARELKVDGLVEGTLLWEGGRVRMNVQLVHGPSDAHVWARSYKRDIREVLPLQAELAEAIAREVRVASAPLPRKRRPATGPRDSIPSELYVRDLYLRGRHAELSRSPLGLQTAKAAYRQVIELDSTFALGYTGLAVVYKLTAEYAYAPKHPALDSSRMFAQRAVALDSTLAETRSVLAVTLADDGDDAAAEREFKRAIELGPSNARAHYRYSVLLVGLGRGEEALEVSKRAEELDPFGPQEVRAIQLFAQYLITGERPWRKVPIEQRRAPILNLEPGHSWAIASQAVFAAEEGKCAEARSEIERAQELNPGNVRLLHFVAGAYWICGDRTRARGVLDQMKRHPYARDHGLWIATVHSMFGEKDSAFAWLDRTDWRGGPRGSLRAYRWLDPLRSDPRYGELLKELGLRDR
jgi:DNA-binding SARP family transcriptional activator/TolB-like protein